MQNMSRSDRFPLKPTGENINMFFTNGSIGYLLNRDPSSWLALKSRNLVLKWSTQTDVKQLQRRPQQILAGTVPC